MTVGSSRLPKMVLNLQPEGGGAELKVLTNMHTPPGTNQRNQGEGACHGWPEHAQSVGQILDPWGFGALRFITPTSSHCQTGLRINHYLRSVEDFNVKLKHHFTMSDKFTGFLDIFLSRDFNDEQDARFRANAFHLAPLTLLSAV